MNIHEYQAKSLLKQYGLKVQAGGMVENPEQALEVAKELERETATSYFVIKAQIHAGGRGKGTVKETGSRGVVLAKSMAEVPEKVKGILGGTLVTKQTGPKGRLVRKVLIAEDVYTPGEVPTKEFYVGILLDRVKGQHVIMASSEGGMDIEEVAEKSPEKIIKEWINPAIGLRAYQCRRIAFALSLSGKSFKEMCAFLSALYEAYIGSDASMIEINPALRTSDERILAVDAKIGLDESALFRHKAHVDLRDINESDSLEVEAGRSGLNYVRLDGNVGCMVNGAGLAMATMDIIKLSGGEPANFLDVGGGASAETVEAGVRIILREPNVRAILINIFGGIVRCDRVAKGVVKAYKNIGKIDVPIVVRLQGTNAEEARKIIEESGLKVYPATLLQEAADCVKKLLTGA